MDTKAMSKHIEFSNLTRRLNTDSSSAWGVHEKALELQRQGDDVILLCVGDPDFRTPEPIIDNAVSYLRVGRTHYSPALGEVNLRRAVADLETRSSPHPCDMDEVVIFPGATQALFAVLSCLLNPGDDIIIPEPMYVGYTGLIDTIGAHLTSVPLQADADFALDINRIKAAVTAKTRVVLVNTPNNPTGSMINQATLRELAQFCLQANLWLVCDEVYSMITFDHKHRSLRASADNLENVVMIDGLSKSHAMSGWRMGWAICPRSLVTHLERFSTATLFGGPQFIQDAAAFALSNDEYYVAEMRDEYQRRRDFCVSRISEIEGVSCACPAAGMFVMMDVRGLGESDVTFAEQLLEAERVSTVPGRGFGPSGEGFVRITLAQPLPVLNKAFERIQRFVEGYWQR
ncbi:MAG: arginine:pyruvate transaminase [Candidatus Azotimanducaceae bacterium]|jgi:arginine:pyruvate transaminase